MTLLRCSNRKCQTAQTQDKRLNERAIKKGGGNWRYAWDCSCCGMGQGIPLRKGSKTWKRLKRSRS